MLVQTTARRLWYDAGCKLRVRKATKKDVWRIPKELDQRPGFWYVEEMPFKLRLVAREDCIYFNVPELGKEKPYPDLESNLQKACVEFCDYHNLLSMHAPNEGKRSKIGHSEKKKEGMRKGWPDLAIIRATDKYHAAGIELKSQGHVVDEDQVRMLQWLHREGWYAGIAWNFDAFTQHLFNAGIIKKKYFQDRCLNVN